MKCYICLTDSIVNRKDYFNMLKVTLISARKNTAFSGNRNRHIPPAPGTDQHFSQRHQIHQRRQYYPAVRAK